MKKYKSSPNGNIQNQNIFQDEDSKNQSTDSINPNSLKAENSSNIDSSNIESYILSSAKHYALRLVNKGIYSFCDLDDLEQEILALFYCKTKNHKHDPNKSTEKYWINFIMQNIYKDLIKKKLNSEDVHKITSYSLNDVIGHINENNSNSDNDSDIELADITEDKNSDTFESYYKTAQRKKLFNLIESLPEDLKEICRLLQEYNVTEISKKLNLSRKTIYQKINKIKEQFNGIDIF